MNTMHYAYIQKMPFLLIKYQHGGIKHVSTVDTCLVWYSALFIHMGLYSLSGKTFTTKSGEKSRSREIVYYDDGISLRFERHLGSIVTFQSDMIILNSNLIALSLHEFLPRYIT